MGSTIFNSSSASAAAAAAAAAAFSRILLGDAENQRVHFRLRIQASITLICSGNGNNNRHPLPVWKPQKPPNRHMRCRPSPSFSASVSTSLTKLQIRLQAARLVVSRGHPPVILFGNIIERDQFADQEHPGRQGNTYRPSAEPLRLYQVFVRRRLTRKQEYPNSAHVLRMPLFSGSVFRSDSFHLHRCHVGNHWLPCG
ncbi:hypothetical protein K432DRAFT_45170 [Lepidopterella palustris CBS 459.81]|uniref:Uncharacterized protein n=1 Tax=Lepidopterella palustris CBS 459.81 TaxID=1314670 RepID=A0A8E2EAR3_9PEZI|nr:hypothetical protein K432DRAFT_45170 [Lepidopterella palustris CBS 459.81]